MNLKRSAVWTAVVTALLVSPAMAVEWQNAKCCDSVSCCNAPSVCNEMACCETDACCYSKTCGLEIGGWLSSGIYANQYGAKSNGPLTMRNYADGYTVDQMWVYAEKKADNGGSGLAFGGRADFIWGADGPDTQCFTDGGWDGNWMTSNDGNYGSALPQLYAEMAYNDLRIKVGHFYTIIGYEVVPAPDNFFYSHSYTLAIEPFTHTGALAEYAVSDDVSVYGGWTNGWDNGWLNPLNASTFLGGVSVDLTDNMSIAYMTSFGDLFNVAIIPDEPNFDLETYMHSLVLKWQMTSRLNYIFQSDFRSDNFKSVYPDMAVKYYGVNQYLLYTINERWAAGTRVEWFRGESPNSHNFVGRSLNAAAVTLGVNYKPNEHVVIRPEIRWDSMGSDPANLAYQFDNATRSSQFSGGFDCIVKY